MQQTTFSVLMIRPVNFAYNIETAASNAFQSEITGNDQQTIQDQALKEFNNFVDTLERAGIDVCVFDDTKEPFTPDSIFPNNWITTHEDGRIVLFPMEAPVRRKERRNDIVDFLKARYDLPRIIDLSILEQQQSYLEGTGSMVLDRPTKVIYACLSSRTSVRALETFAEEMGYKVISFKATDANGTPIYHTNVMMALGTDLAVVCLDAISNTDDLDRVTSELVGAGKTIINISMQQMEMFAGNMLELRTRTGEKIIILSSSAYNALTAGQKHIMEQAVQLLPVDIQTIEKVGGGSARCMLAEIF